MALEACHFVYASAEKTYAAHEQVGQYVMVAS